MGLEAVDRWLVRREKGGPWVRPFLFFILYLYSSAVFF